MSARRGFKALNAALRSLACTDASLKGRLDSAIAELNGLREVDLPPDFRPEFRQLLGMIRLHNESNDQSDVQSAIAQTILELYTNLVADTGMTSM